jgi:hypothetical protein
MNVRQLVFTSLVMVVLWSVLTQDVTAVTGYVKTKKVHLICLIFIIRALDKYYLNSLGLSKRIAE